METEMSLDDIIQKKFKTKNVKGQRGGRMARGGKGQGKINAAGGVQSNPNKNVSNPRGGVSPGLQGRRKGRGGGNRPVSAPISDARLRIIQQKRQKITDAREKLGEIAKMSDARDKLNKLHHGGVASLAGSKLSKQGGITVQTGRNGQIQLSTNKARITHQPKGSYKEPGRIIGNGRGRMGNPIIPSLLDIDIDVEDEPPLLLRRTVNNSLLDPPKLPLFSSSQQREMYTWVKPPADEMMDDPYEHVHMPRSRPTVRPPILRESLLGPSMRQQTPTNIRIRARNTSPKASSDWFLGERATRRPTREERPSARYSEQAVYSDDDEPVVRSRNESNIRTRGVGVKSRLLSSAPAPRSMGILSAESRSSVAAENRSQPRYHRIIVSNLQKSVTNEDIRELFEDVASLVSSKLVRPGTAEVMYRSRKDAVKAVEVYHNRQLDGEPMKCMLVNPRPFPTAVQPSASRNASTGSSNFRGASSRFPTTKVLKPTIYPDMDTIHKALFKRS